jgi:signal transduction histidine kinase/ligand-binding sensor protein
MHDDSVELQRYRKLFTDTIEDLAVFLNGLFSSLFSKWGGYTILPWGAWGNYRKFEDPKKFADFCYFVREVLQKRELCYACDDRMAKEAADVHKPLAYWCDWGLRDIAVPITAHGVCVGTIFCGQARLQGPEDAEGETRMEAFARAHQLGEHIDELREHRRASPAVAQERIEELKRLLWATSQYISQVLYAQTNPDAAVPESQTHTRLTQLWAKFAELTRESTPKSFWKDLKPVIDQMANLFDCRGVLVLLTEADDVAAVLSHGLQLGYAIPKGASLITAGVGPFGGPQHMSIEAGSPLPECFVVNRAVQQFPGIELVVFEKARIDEKRTLHFLVFFDRTVSRRNNLLLHQKKQVLSQFVLETVNSLVNLERISELSDDLKRRNTILLAIAHQMVQPLHGIVGHCDNLVTGVYSTDRSERVIGYLLHRAKHLSVFARCVEYASRGEKNIFAGLQLKPSQHSLSKILIENAITFQGYGEERKISVHVEENRTDPIGVISIDPDWLEMAVTNVLFNAVKYAFPDTQVTIWAERDGAKRQLIIYFKNIGIEVPLDKWDLIFTRDYRTPLAKKFSQGGLGIGLFVTRELMRRMAGDAYVVESTSTGERYKEFAGYSNVFALALPDSAID